LAEAVLVEPAAEVAALPDCDPAVVLLPAADCAAGVDVGFVVFVLLAVSDDPAPADAVADPQERSTRVPRYVIVFI